MSAPTNIRTKVFISYSHRDKKHLDRLLIHLAPHEREGEFDVWADTKILAGDEWRKEIRQALASAKVAIILVSAPFRASKFIAEDELPPLLTAAKSEGVLILPVVVGACDFNSSELADIQAVNEPSKPLDAMTGPQRDAVWVRVVLRTKQALASSSPPQSQNTTSAKPTSPMLAKLQEIQAQVKDLRVRGRNDAAVWAAQLARHWSPEARKVLEYLVLNGEPERYMPLVSLQNGTLLDDTALFDALHELKDVRLIRSYPEKDDQFPLVGPHIAAWQAIDQQLLGYDVKQDMLIVADCIVRHSQIEAQELEQETQLPLKRLNIAALLLQAHDSVQLIQPGGANPYAFSGAIATYKTRQFLKKNRPT